MALKNKLRFKVSDIAPSHIGQIMQPENLARLQIDNAELVIECEKLRAERRAMPMNR